MRRLALRFTLAISLLLLVSALFGATWGYLQLTGSLPQLDGEVFIDGVSAAVIVERDGLGIPTIRAANRTDLAYATGFLHAQDRFFQMDLLRRNSAGELSELVGPALLEQDRRVRVNRFRRLAQQRLESEESAWLGLLDAYTEGVNAGLRALNKPPFEYLLLGSAPQAWRPEDSLLVIFSMFLDLQDDAFDYEYGRGLLQQQLPSQLFEFLMARGDQWDAPLQGQPFEVPEIPGPEVFDLRGSHSVAIDPLRAVDNLPWESPYQLGSNNWAVAGMHTADGRALLADDMHLRLQVPHIWYRASFEWSAEGDPSDQQRITGVTLPGTPAMIVGSNGHIAWGFTNTEGDWADVVIVEVDPNDPDSYRTPAGNRKFVRHQERIQVKGAPDDVFEVVSTEWGPVVKIDHDGRPLAIRWVAHDPEGANFGLLEMETIRSLEAALDQANVSGVPHQNFVVADDSGRIAWTVVGRIPRRFGHDGWLPRSWADGAVGWDGYLPPDEYPRIVDPPVGRLWTANARVVGDEFYRIVGDSGYDRGARQQQIRDSLLDLEKATEADMLRIQLDDRALFWQRWQQLLLAVLSPEAVRAAPNREQLRRHVEQWGGRAAVESVGYRVVWRFRGQLIAQLSDLFSQPCRQVDPDFSLTRFRRIEGPFWKIITERPAHLLDPRYENWDDWLLAAVDAVIDDATQAGAPLDQYTWGAQNTTRIQHPLSLAVPLLSGWLDMPARQLPGGWSDMPRIQAPAMGASQRMAVSPGREQDGYMHIPCGQSGHPWSPYYANSHAAWADGHPSPFLPGETVHTLVLRPR